MNIIKKILIISSDKNLKDVLNFCFDGWGYEVFLRDFSRNDNLSLIKKILPDVIVVDVQSARKEQLDICRLLKNDFATAFIPVIALINKRHLRAQLLNLKEGVDDYLIKPPDPLDLRIRIEMAMRRSQHSINASALTGLPGGKILGDILKERIQKGEPFSFGYLDIDNFKYFNDLYGYQKGDKVILQTAYILFTEVTKFGNNNDFISHIGGDDFAFVSTPDKYEQICYNCMQGFDSIMPFYYPEDDRSQGFIIARDRTRKLKKIPLMSISIAVVNNQKPALFKSNIEINERIAEIKRYLKTIPGSKFMADRRDGKINKTEKPQGNKNVARAKAYRPIGQMLLEKNMISLEQLDDALGVHWKKGIFLGEILKELGFISEDNLRKELDIQKNNYSESIFKN